MLMILNHTYNMERNKQLYREEIYKLQNIYNFKIEDIGKFRLEDHALRQMKVGSGSFNPAVDNL